MSDRNGDLPNGWVQATIAELCDLNPKHDHALSDETPVSFVPMAAVSDVLGTITELQVRTLGEIRKGYTPTTPLDLAVPCRWLWDAPGEYAVTGRAHLQVGQQLTAEVLTDAVGNLRRR